MLINEIKLSYNDIGVKPAIKSRIEHRSQCNPYVWGVNITLPIFASPMSTVVNKQNFGLFEANNIIPILPRNIDLNTRLEYLKKGKWVAVGLEEFDELFLKKEWEIDYTKTLQVRVLIDIANGHMIKMHQMVKQAKDKYGDKIVIMVGNIANPETYTELAKAGADYIRFSVGTGNFCTTSSNTSVHYPIISLLLESYEIKRQLEQMGMKTPKIIADGGIRNFDDVIKALACGADYVMIGSEFVKLVESAAPTFYYKDGSMVEIDPFEHQIEANIEGTFEVDGEYTIDNLYKVGYGMASRRGQEDINGKKTKTSEGIEKVFNCTTNMRKWAENMESFMRSAMSYLDCFSIIQINPDNVDVVRLSNATKESINK